jgi:hypothetical protein
LTRALLVSHAKRRNLFPVRVRPDGADLQLSIGKKGHGVGVPVERVPALQVVGEQPVDQCAALQMRPCLVLADAR